MKTHIGIAPYVVNESDFMQRRPKRLARPSVYHAVA